MADIEAFCREIVLGCVYAIPPVASTAFSFYSSHPSQCSLPVAGPQTSTSRHVTSETNSDQGISQPDSLGDSPSVDKLKIRIEPIQKLRITPEKLAKKKSGTKIKKARKSSLPSSDDGSLKVRIVTPNSKKTLQYASKQSDIQTVSTESLTSATTPTDTANRRRYSIFKSRNAAGLTTAAMTANTSSSSIQVKSRLIIIKQ